MFNIREELKKLPSKPGVYIHKDKNDEIIYVGKAVSLKNRVRQYFNSPKNMDAKTRSLSQNIISFEYITTKTEAEALLLECTLIKKYMPKYNILLRDDKTYPYIKIEYEKDFPRLLKTRILDKKNGKYFGPYTEVGAVNRVLDLFNNIFKLKRCNTNSFPKDFKPCLNYHIDQCDGVCINKITKDEYLEKLKLIEKFLNGDSKELLQYLKNEMMEASESLNFEKAGKFRDYINDVKSLTEKQNVSGLNIDDMDIVISRTLKNTNIVVLFFVRDGKLSGREKFTMKGIGNNEESVREFIKQHYIRVAEIPREIIVEDFFEERENLQELLTEISGRKVGISKVYRGKKKALLTLAQEDVEQLIKTLREREENKELKRISLINDLIEISKEVGFDKDKLTFDGFENFRIEMYDISNTQGVDSVGGMVVFNGNDKNTKAYRKFKIKTVEGADDYSSLQEVLIRRMTRGHNGDKSFLPLPDLIIMDGGKGQVTAGKEALREVGSDISIIGLAKNDRHRTDRVVYIDENGELKEIPLKNKATLFKYFGGIQEEVHRYAIEYHRKSREKNLQKSVLDEIEGIGETFKARLLKHFKTIDNIAESTKDELKTVEGIGEKQAENIYKFFHNGEM